jgi:hypothetical protein
MKQFPYRLVSVITSRRLSGAFAASAASGDGLIIEASLATVMSEFGPRAHKSHAILK